MCQPPSPMPFFTNATRLMSPVLVREFPEILTFVPFGNKTIPSSPDGGGASQPSVPWEGNESPHCRSSFGGPGRATAASEVFAITSSISNMLIGRLDN